jgi:hypothetical protein
MFERITLSLYAVNCDFLAFDRCRFYTFALLVSCTNTMLANCTASVKVGFTGASSCGESSGSRPDSATDPAVTTANVLLMANGIELSGPSKLETKLPVSVYGGGDYGIEVTEHGHFRQDDACPYVGGDSNATCGIGATNYGSARIRGGVNTTITGPAGSDLSVGGGFVPYGTGVGGFEEVAGYNGNLHNTYVTAGGVPLGNFARIYK